MNKLAKIFKQPTVFPLATILAMFERLGFYILIFLLVFFLKDHFNLSDHKAFVLFATFNALVYLTPAIGGYIADNILGIRRAIIIGVLLEGIGLNLLALQNDHALYLGLALIIVGVGLFRTAPTNLLARNYSDKDPNIDRGFTLFYMAINLGSAMSPVIGGFLQRDFGWPAVFNTAAISLYASLIAYYFFRHKAKNLDVLMGRQKLTKIVWLQIIIGIIAITILCYLLIQHATIAHIFFYAATAVLMIYIIAEIGKSTRKEKLAIIKCLALIWIAMVFFVMYYQLPMSIALFIKRCVNLNIFGFNLPASSPLSLDAIWIVIISPILVWLYSYLGKKGKDPKMETKFALGILFIGVAFLVLSLSAYFANSAYQISILWFTFAIFFYALGELLTSALGLAMVTKTVPRRIYGVMMGAWYLITNTLAFTLASSVASLTDIPKAVTSNQIILHTYSKTFLEIGLAGLAIAVIMLMIKFGYFLFFDKDNR